MSRYRRRPEITTFYRDLLAVHAVPANWSARANFPANREKADFWAFWANICAINRSEFRRLLKNIPKFSQNPTRELYRDIREFSSPEQGKSCGQFMLAR